MILGLLLAFPSPLTFEAHAEPVKSVVERLAEETQTPLLCANDVGTRRVIAIVKNVDPAEFRARLAKAVGADWVETPKGLRLEILPKVRGAEVQRHTALRTAWITKTLNEFQSVDEGAWDAATAKKLFQNQLLTRERAQERGYFVQETVAVEPTIRAGRRVLSALGPAALAGIDWGQKRVWSTRTQGRFVSPLPESVRQTVRMFNQESETMQAVFTSNPALAKGFQFSFVFGPRRGATDPLLAEATDITLEVSRKAFSPDLNIAVFFSSANGTIVDSAWLSLADLWSTGLKLEGPVAEFSKELRKIPVTLSPQAKDWFHGRDVRNFRWLDAIPEARRFPERYEPLHMIFTDAFRAVSEAKQLNIVAQVGDLDLRLYGGVKDATPIQDLFANGGENVRLDQKWLVIGTNDQGETDRARLDRSVLGTYLRTIIGDGFDSIRAFMPVLRASEGMAPHPAITATIWGFRLDRLSGAGIPDANVLSLLDRFPAATRRSTLGELRPVERQAVERYLYGPGDIRFQGFDPASVLQPPHIERLPNIAYPNGLQNDLIFDLRVVEEDVTFQAPGADSQLDGTHTPRNSVLLALAPPTASQGAEPLYRMGKSIQYDLTIEQPKLRKTSQSITDHVADLSRPAVGFGQLPEWFRQKVDAVRKGN